MKRRISFIHTADLHLDSPFKGISHLPEPLFAKVRESTFKAFERLIDYAIEKKVDFVLVVGDLFDEENQSLKAQLHVRDQFQKLEDHGIEVFLSFGNHDYLKGNPYPIQYGSNVHVFPGEEVTYFPFHKEGETLAHIYGFSYVNGQVKDNKSKAYRIENREVPFHIATLHGSLYGSQGHDPYAPFRLEDLLQETFDYWALGHIHKREELSYEPPIIYPGNIQGRHRKETGEKGCYYVELTKQGAVCEFIPVQEVVFVDVTVDLRPCRSIGEIEGRIEKHLSAIKGEQQLVHLELQGSREQLDNLRLMDYVDQLIEVINERLLRQLPWQYIYRYRYHLLEKKRSPVDSLFVKELKEVAQRISLQDVLEDFYTHPLGRKVNYTFDEQELIADALEYIQDALSEKGR